MGYFLCNEDCNYIIKRLTLISKCCDISFSYLALQSAYDLKCNLQSNVDLLLDLVDMSSDPIPANNPNANSHNLLDQMDSGPKPTMNGGSMDFLGGMLDLGGPVQQTAPPAAATNGMDSLLNMVSQMSNNPNTIPTNQNQGNYCKFAVAYD